MYTLAADFLLNNDVLEINPKETSLTPQDFLEYFYYAGLWYVFAFVLFVVIIYSLKTTIILIFFHSVRFLYSYHIANDYILSPHTLPTFANVTFISGLAIILQFNRCQKLFPRS